MRTLSVGRRVVAATLAGVLLPLYAAAAPAPPDKDAAVRTTANARDALDRVVTLNVDKPLSLSAAVAQLRTTTKLTIVLDAASILQLGVNPDQAPVPAPADFKDVKLRTALRTMLEPYDLHFVTLGDTIFISTEDAATARQMGQHVSVHVNNVELAAALKQLARDTGANLPIDPRAEQGASAKVSLDLDDVPLQTAVRLLTEMAGLKMVRAANTLFVTKKDVAVAMRADPDLNPPPSPAPVAVSDRDFLINAQVWQAQGRMPGQVVRLPISVVQPAPIQKVEEPAIPETPPAPEKQDGDK
jgi:hypothetical protein